jgi:glycerol uptake facilitator-like aquaporin
MLYIAISFGFSLMVNVWIFFRISGGLFNPAVSESPAVLWQVMSNLNQVTLALWATGAVGSTRAICLFFSQIVGSITASALVLAMFPTPLNVRTTLSEGTSLAQGVFIEALMTSELVFTILMLAIEKHKSTFIAPVGIGLALFVAELVGVYYTGGSLNPARSLGPCIITNLYDAEHWIYWVGPGLGSILAVGFYKFIKMLEYEMANPGQDGDEHNDPTKNPNHEVREKQRTSTARVLQALGYPTMAHEEAQANPDTLRQAEEGTHCGHCSRPVSMLDTADDLEQPMHSGLALSTVASMSDAHQSPVRQIYSPSRGGFPSEKRTNVRSS